MNRVQDAAAAEADEPAADLAGSAIVPAVDPVQHLVAAGHGQQVHRVRLIRSLDQRLQCGEQVEEAVLPGPSRVSRSCCRKSAL